MSIRGRYLSTLVCCAAMIVASGCSDDGTEVDSAVPDGIADIPGVTDLGVDGTTPVDGAVCTLAIATINGKPAAGVTKVVGDDDQDLATSGIQLDVEVTGSGLSDGTTVSLSVTQQADMTATASQGKATFSGVTVDSKLTSVVLTATADGCQVASKQLSVEPTPECVIIDPANGTILGKADNKSTTAGVFQYDVVVSVKNAAGGEIALSVDGNPTGQKQTIGATETVSFASTQLPPDKNGVVIKADVVLGNVTRSCQVTVDIRTGDPQCNVQGFTPAAVDVPAPVGPAKGLGVAQDANSATPGLETGLTVEVGSFVDEVTLLVDGASAAKQSSVTGGSVTFSDVALTDGAHTVTAICVETSSGNSSQSAPVSVLVDSQPPSDVADFQCVVDDNREGKVTCTWTTVADNTGGTGVNVYDVRYSVGTALNDSNWASAAKAGEVSIATAGQPGQLVLQDLPLAETYYFGVRAVDYVANGSNIDDDGQGQGKLLDFVKLERQLPAGAAGGWGAQVATGDFNCDGFTDVALGSPQDNSGLGQVYIYLGNASGVLQNPEKVLSGTVTGGNFGARVVALDDFNGDNCNDLLVWASHGETQDARLFVYLGRQLFFDRQDVTTGLGAELILSLSSPQSTELLGKGVASAGDFDNDGATDIALTHTDSASDSATLLLVYGDSTLPKMQTGASPVTKTLPGDAGVQITGGKLSEGFGVAMASGAQLNSDSFADLVLGAPATTGGGAAYVIEGGARASTLPEQLTLADARVHKIAGGSGNGAFGGTVAFAGDMDKDGTPEFAVADPMLSSATGAVYLFNLGTTPPASVSDAVATVAHDVTGATGNKFGLALGGAGLVDGTNGADLDGDGYADLLVGVETLGSTGAGAVLQISGGPSLSGLASSKASYTFLAPSGAPSFGATVNLAKDINNDNHVDVVIGDPQYNSGAGRLFLFY